MCSPLFALGLALGKLTVCWVTFAVVQVKEQWTCKGEQERPPESRYQGAKQGCSRGSGVEVKKEPENLRRQSSDPSPGQEYRKRSKFEREKSWSVLNIQKEGTVQ